MPTTTTTRNIGMNKGKPRLWIEGNVLVDAGLDHGQRWNLEPHGDGAGFTIAWHPEGKRKIAGKPGRPIIDITGATLSSFGFQHGHKAILTYDLGHGRIVVRNATPIAELDD